MGKKFKVGRIGNNDFYHVADTTDDSFPSCSNEQRLTHSPRHWFNSLDEAMQILGVRKEQFCVECVESLIGEIDRELVIPDHVDYKVKVFRDTSGDEEDEDYYEEEKWMLLQVKANGLKVGEISGPHAIINPIKDMIDGKRVQVDD